MSNYPNYPIKKVRWILWTDEGKDETRGVKHISDRITPAPQDSLLLDVITRYYPLERDDEIYVKNQAGQNIPLTMKWGQIQDPALVVTIRRRNWIPVSEVQAWKQQLREV